MSDRTLFGVLPYVAAAGLATFTALRLLLGRERGWPGDTRAARRLFSGGRAWRMGLAGLVLGHALVLGFPGALRAWNQDVARLIAFEVALFVAGVCALGGLLGVIARVLGDPERRAQSSPPDLAFLGLLLVQVVSGLSLAAVHRWASAWATVTITPYLHSLPTLQPALGLVEGSPYLARLHLFSAMVLACLFPFTRLADAAFVPLNRGIDFLLRPFQVAGGRAQRLVQGWARQGGRRLGWIEEED